MTRQTLTTITIAVLVAVTLRVALLVFKYHYGYLENNLTIISPDEIGYLFEAKNDTPEVRLGAHWLYSWLNHLVFSMLGDIDTTYIALCTFNISLGVALPFALLPAIRSFSLDSQRYNQIFLATSLVLLFWPASILLSTANLKDPLLAFLVALYISLVLTFTARIERARGGALLSVIPLFFMLVVTGYFVFTLRSYLSLFLIGSTLILLFLKRGRYLLKLTVAGVILGGLTQTGISDYLFAFFEYENNWLLNSYVQEEVSRDVTARGENALVINRTPVAIGMGAVKFVLSPFPSLVAEDLPSFLLSAQTAFALFFIGPLIQGLKRLREHPQAIFFYCLLVSVVLFYGAVESYSGPRQRFVSLDIVLILVACTAAVGALHEGDGGERRRLLRLSFLSGLVINVVFVLFTSRAAL